MVLVAVSPPLLDQWLRELAAYFRLMRLGVDLLLAP